MSAPPIMADCQLCQHYTRNPAEYPPPLYAQMCANARASVLRRAVEYDEFGCESYEERTLSNAVRAALEEP